MKKALRKMILWMCVLIFIISTIFLFMMDTVQSVGEEKIIRGNVIPKDINVILVLGAGIEEDGKPCDMLIDRLETAMIFSRKIYDVKLLLSGDHRKDSYNEVGTMKKYIMKSSYSIDEEIIFLDHAGFSTYDSIYRAKEIFDVDKMIIITNEYHLPRALYIAAKLGIEAYGIKSDMRDYENIEIYKEREVLAQIKDFMYVNILKPRPKFLGGKIPIDKRNGKSTDDL